MNIEEFYTTKIGDQTRWPGFLFLNVAKVGESVLSEMLKDLDITTNQWPVLHQIYEHTGSTQKQLAEYCMKDPSAVLRSLDHLEKKGLIERKNDENDRRAFKILLTQKGEAVHQEALSIAIKCTIMACEGLRQEDLDKLYDISMALFKNWTNMKENIEIVKEKILS